MRRALVLLLIAVLTALVACRPQRRPSGGSISQIPSLSQETQWSSTFMPPSDSESISMGPKPHHRGPHHGGPHHGGPREGRPHHGGPQQQDGPWAGPWAGPQGAPQGGPQGGPQQQGGPQEEMIQRKQGGHHKKGGDKKMGGHHKKPNHAKISTYINTLTGPTTESMHHAPTIMKSSSESQE
mmetsp:Transcript_101757/g.141363  ORF Transcript_101757/g.141363 Transcript_101757/m.141363 type:complete len:182 (+) Transcript_101757:46-591(+)